jgi:hypothetical protein
VINPGTKYYKCVNTTKKNKDEFLKKNLPLYLNGSNEGKYS